MFEPEESGEVDSARLAEIYRRAPVGAMAVAGIATAIVFALWAVFFLVIFLPRGLLQ